ncbi:hypothetical protein C2857_004758 [Epichloe festucae Fl1]|uniref:Uncharacterized protein n=1 Tax=Epichloe festucae (strain Fl1) TaxID=877507 RepID=A0A7S9KSE7_EPIFF|nr:hypothetical protein C2857_004758 [Epichloe festucae Fl1]
MRFAVALVSGLAAAVSAQTNSVAADPATASAAACLKKCAVGDVNCQSHCITVPNPNEQQVNDTTKCAAACPQGKGSPEETQKYSDCVQGCISKHYYVSSEGTPQATGGSGGNGGDSNSNTSAAPPSAASATATGGATSTASASSGSGSGSGSQTSSSGADAGASQTTGSNSGSKTSTGAAATSTNAAPGMMPFGATGALVGAFAALLAL